MMPDDDVGRNDIDAGGPGGDHTVTFSNGDLLHHGSMIAPPPQLGLGTQTILVAVIPPRS
jgi:hypothetical protein